MKTVGYLFPAILFLFALARCAQVAHERVATTQSTVSCDDTMTVADRYAAGVTIIRAYCTSLSACCAAPFDVDRCVANNVWPTQIFSHPTFNVPEAQRGLDAGDILVDQGRLQACLADLAQMPCSTIESDFFLTYMRDCSNVYVGTLPPGATCTNYFECAGESWCPSGPGLAVRRCTSLSAVVDSGYSPIGAWCGTDESNFGCQVHGASASGAWCDTDNTQTCLPELPLDASDPYPGACASGLATGGGCAASVPWVTSSSFFCHFYAIPDGGTE